MPVNPLAAEVKAIDTSYNLAADTTGAVGLLNGAVPGTAFAERVGRLVQNLSLEINVYSFATPATGTDQTHRFMIVQDLQPNGAALTIANVLTAATVQDFPNLYYQHRFKILLDRKIYLNAAAETGTGKLWSWRCKLPFVTQYNNGTAGTVADIATNSIYCLAIGDVAAGNAAGVEHVHARVRFVDY